MLLLPRGPPPLCLGARQEWRRGRLRPQHLTPTTSRRGDPLSSFCSTQGTETLSWLRRMSAFWGQSCPRIKLGLLATGRPGCRGSTADANRRNQRHKPSLREQGAGAQGSSMCRDPPWALLPLLNHLWQDSSSSSANVLSLRASILNSLCLMNKHSFFNGE